jgi:hypothetical protein
MFEVALEEIGKFINTVGFPIFVGVYMLIRYEPILKGINETNAAILEYLRTDSNIKRIQA